MSTWSGLRDLERPRPASLQAPGRKRNRCATRTGRARAPARGSRPLARNGVRARDGGPSRGTGSDVWVWRRTRRTRLGESAQPGVHHRDRESRLASPNCRVESGSGRAIAAPTHRSAVPAGTFPSRPRMICGTIPAQFTGPSSPSALPTPVRTTGSIRTAPSPGQPAGTATDLVTEAALASCRAPASDFGRRASLPRANANPVVPAPQEGLPA
jgi:hypothetical protein